MENHQNYQTSQVFGMALFVSLSLSLPLWMLLPLVVERSKPKQEEHRQRNC